VVPYALLLLLLLKPGAAVVLARAAAMNLPEVTAVPVVVVVVARAGVVVMVRVALVFEDWDLAEVPEVLVAAHEAPRSGGVRVARWDEVGRRQGRRHRARCDAIMCMRKIKSWHSYRVTKSAMRHTGGWWCTSISASWR
jgi:hypothetical protein